MKKTINILRSIITSLLFLSLILIIIVQFSFTAIRLSNKNLPDLINRETVLDTIIESDINLDKKDRELAIEYIDNYVNYVFHKRSFPSTEEFDKTSLSEDEVKEKKRLLTAIRSKIDMKYDSVLLLRDFNNFLSNGSIYLLINIALFINILLILITSGNISNAFSIFGLSAMMAGLIILISSSILPTRLPKILDSVTMNFVEDILNKEFLTKIFNQALIYIAIGFFVFIITYIVKKLILKKQN